MHDGAIAMQSRVVQLDFYTSDIIYIDNIISMSDMNNHKICIQNPDIVYYNLSLRDYVISGTNKCDKFPGLQMKWVTTNQSLLMLVSAQ